MKKYLGFLLFLCSTGLMFGQATATFTCNQNNGNALTAVNQFCTSNKGTNTLPSGTDTHNVYIAPVGTPGSVTVILQGSVIGDFTDATTCGTAVVTQNLTTAPSITCSGVYAKVRAKITALSGFTAVNITYNGTSTSTKKGGLNGVTPTSPIVATLVSGTLNISCPTCSVGSTGLTSVVMPADLYSTNTVGTVETVTKQNQNANYILKGQPIASQTPYLVSTTTCNLASASALVCPLNSASGAGHLIVVIASHQRSDGTLSDNLSSSYTQGAVDTNYTHLYGYYLANSPAGITSVTVTFAGGSSVGNIHVEEWANVATSTPLDVIGFTDFAACTPPAVFASTTTVNANDVFINVAATTAATTYTAGTGYILVGQTQSGASGLALASQYANLSVAGAYTPSIGCSTGSQQAITMAFKGAASPVSGQPIYTPAFVSDFKSIAIGPIYNHTGVFQNVLPHTVSDVCTLGTSCSVTLTGASVFTSSTSYQCVCTDQTSAAACKFAPSSGSAFALTGTGTDVLSYLCAGN